MSDQIELKKAFVFLTSLKEQSENKGDIEETFVNLYHNEIDRLVKLGYNDLEEFRIPMAEVKPRITGHNLSGNACYSTEKYVKKDFFLLKLNAILAFFNILSPETKIGFQDENE